MTAPFYLRVSNQSCYKYVITNDMCTKTSSYLYGNLLPTKMAACSILVLAWPYIHPHKAIIIKYGVWSDFNIKPECLMFAKRRILSTSNRIPTRGQLQKMLSCILPVARFLGNTIVLSNWIIVWYKCCSHVTIVQPDVTMAVPWQLSTGSKHDYFFCDCPLVGILFELLRINSTWWR